MSTRFQAVVLGVLGAFVIACLALVVWRLTTPAESTDQVTLSVDGAQWTAAIEEAFFFSDEAWSPGQTRSASFWVRNDADVAADVDIVVSTTAGEALTESGQVVLSAAIGDGGDVQAFVPGRGVNTLRLGVVEPRERETVTFRAEHSGEAELDSSLLRHRISGSGLSVEEPGSPLDATEARLELAPLFLGIALLVTLLVMRRSQPPRPRSGRRP